MKFTVTIDRDEDGVYVVECPSIPGCISQGKTIEEALDNYIDAIKECLEVRSERGMSTEERLNKLRQACGMWKDRDDLPDLREMREGWDRRIMDRASDNS